jgi:hypothetical protein
MKPFDRLVCRIHLDRLASMFVTMSVLYRAGRLLSHGGCQILLAYNGGRPMRKLVWVLVVLIAAGCAAGNEKAGSPLVSSAPNLSVDDAKKLVASDRSRLWKDPDSIRDAARIGQPYACTGGLAHVANMPNA